MAEQTGSAALEAVFGKRPVAQGDAPKGASAFSSVFGAPKAAAALEKKAPPDPGIMDYLNAAFRTGKNVIGGTEALGFEAVASGLEHGRALGQWLDRTLSGPAQAQMVRRNQARDVNKPRPEDLFRQAAAQLRHAGDLTVEGRPINPIAQKGLGIVEGVGKGIAAAAAGGPAGFIAQQGLETEQAGQEEAKAQGLPRDVQQARGTAQGLAGAATATALGMVPGAASIATKIGASGVIGVGGQVAANEAARVTGDPKRSLTEGITEAGLTMAGITALTHVVGKLPVARPNIEKAVAEADAHADIAQSAERFEVAPAGTSAGPLGTLEADSRAVLADKGISLVEGGSARPGAATEPRAIDVAAEQSARAHFERNATLGRMKENPELQTLALEFQETKDPARQQAITERLQDEARMFLRPDEIEYLSGERGMPPEMPQGEISPPGIKLSGAAPPAPLPEAQAKALALETGHTSAEIQTAKPMPPIIPEADIPSVKSRAPVVQTLLKWDGDKLGADTFADILARGHEKELFDLAGRRSPARYLGDLIKTDPRNQGAVDLAYAIHAYIDTYGKTAEVLARTGAKLLPRDRAALERAMNLAPKELDLAERIRAENTQHGQVLQDAALIAEAKENYTARIYKPLREGPSGAARGKFTTTSPRLKQRSYDTIFDALADGRELAVDSAIEAQRLAMKQTSQVIADKQLLAMLKKSGDVSSHHGEGMKLIDHPSFMEWTHVGSIKAGSEYAELAMSGREKNLHINSDGDIFLKKPLYAAPELANKLNNVLGRSALEGRLPGYSEWAKLRDAQKAWIFTGNFFHNLNVTYEYASAAPLREMNPYQAWRAGRGEIARYEPHLKALVEQGGLEIGAMPDMDARMLAESTAIGKIIDKVPVAAEVKQAATVLRDALMNMTFKDYIPALKAHFALLHLHKQMANPRIQAKLASGEMSMADVYEVSARLSNDLFTGPRLQRHGPMVNAKLGEFSPRNPTAQGIVRDVIAAPSWTESNIRMATLALKNGEIGMAYKQMFFQQRLRSVIAAQAFNVGMSIIPDMHDGKSTNWIDRFQENFKWFDLDITPVARLAGYKDPEHLYWGVTAAFSDVQANVYNRNPQTGEFEINLGRGLSRKASWAAGAAIDSLTGTDYRGAPFTTAEERFGVDDKGTYKTFGKGHAPGMSKGGKSEGQLTSFKSGEKGPFLSGDQLPSFLEYEGQRSVPIPMQTAIAYLRGNLDTFTTLGRMGGFVIRKERKDKAKK